MVLAWFGDAEVEEAVDGAWAVEMVEAVVV